MKPLPSLEALRAAIGKDSCSLTVRDAAAVPAWLRDTLTVVEVSLMPVGVGVFVNETARAKALRELGPNSWMQEMSILAATSTVVSLEPRSYELVGDGIRCLRCQQVSHNPHDVAERYCAHCHRFHDPSALVRVGPSPLLGHAPGRPSSD